MPKPAPYRSATIHVPWGDASISGVASDAPAAPASGTAQPSRSGDVAVEDWDDLCGAVMERLRLAVGERAAESPESPSHGAPSRVQESVLECVEALGQLRTTLAHELARRQQLELEIFDVRTALAQARSELAGAHATQAGEKRARHLGVTPNRSHFREQLEDALNQLHPGRQVFSVVTLDLEGFKSINDAHGHVVGDQLLSILAERMNRSMRCEDRVSHLGGDKFACLLAGLPGREPLRRLAGQLIDTVSEPVKLGTLMLSVSPRIGIAMCPNDGVTAEALLQRADAAMRRAKRHLSCFAFFDQGVDA